MSKTLFVVLTIFALFSLGSSVWSPTHQYSGATSSEIANGIKAKLLANLGSIADTDFAKRLEADLNTSKDSDRSVKEISAVSASQIFNILKIQDPKCDANGDKTISGDELKCLNFIWKAFVPN